MKTICLKRIMSRESKIKKSTLVLFLMLSLLSVSGFAQSDSLFNPKHFTVMIERMNPMALPSRDVGYTFSLSLKNDTIDLYLPYQGKAYQLPYGGGDGLNFKESIKDYKSTTNDKGLYKIYFTTRHQQFYYKFYLQIYPENGSCYIDLNPSNCDFISYQGRLEKEKDRKK